MSKKPEPVKTVPTTGTKPPTAAANPPVKAKEETKNGMPGALSSSITSTTVPGQELNSDQK